MSFFLETFGGREKDKRRPRKGASFSGDGMRHCLLRGRTCTLLKDSFGSAPLAIVLNAFRDSTKPGTQMSFQVKDSFSLLQLKNSFSLTQQT